MSKSSSILIYTPKLNARIAYTLRHCIEKMLGSAVEFTNSVEVFVASNEVKFSYSNKPLGSEFFVEKHGLLDEVGFNDVDISMSKWEELQCFFRVSAASSLPFDIFSASFYLLSRYEEYQPYVKDASGAFPATESLAHKNGFLTMPLVDLWMNKFSALLQEKFRQLSIPTKPYRQNFILTVHQAFAYAHKNFFRQLVGFVRDLVLLKLARVIERTKVVTHLIKDPYDTYDYILDWMKKNQYTHYWFFQLGDFTRSNRNISPHSMPYHQLIRHVSDFAPIGLLLSKEAINNTKTLQVEMKRWNTITHQNLTSVFLSDPSLGFPEIYLNAQDLGLKNDYSLGFVNSIGFRASTCTPFYFYDLNLEQTTHLQIHPYAIHFDVVKKSSDKQVLDQVMNVKNYTKKLGGSLNIILENTTFTKQYIPLLEALNASLN